MLCLIVNQWFVYPFPERNAFYRSGVDVAEISYGFAFSKSLSIQIAYIMNVTALSPFICDVYQKYSVPGVFLALFQCIILSVWLYECMELVGMTDLIEPNHVLYHRC